MKSSSWNIICMQNLGRWSQIIYKHIFFLSFLPLFKQVTEKRVIYEYVWNVQCFNTHLFTNIPFLPRPFTPILPPTLQLVSKRGNFFFFNFCTVIYNIAAERVSHLTLYLLPTPPPTPEWAFPFTIVGTSSLLSSTTSSCMFPSEYPFSCSLFPQFWSIH